jgi:hypothetical protein
MIKKSVRKRKVYTLENRKMCVCGKHPKVRNQPYCYTCRIRAKRDCFEEKYKGRKMCTRCMFYPVAKGSSLSTCPKCIRTKRHLYEERRERGLCYRCGRPTERGFVRCERCRIMGRRHTIRWRRDNKKHWKDLVRGERIRKTLSRN